MTELAFGIIAAAGFGTRFGAPKLEISLLGKPILHYSLEAFQSADPIESVVLAVPAGLASAWSAERLRSEGFTKVARTVEGGATRQDSVRAALEEIDREEGVVVVHDAARPVVTGDMVSAVCAALEGADGVITCVPVTDTIKEVDSGLVVRTLDRDRLVSVQTPQAFKLGALRRAHSQAVLQNRRATDDASLVEWLEGRIRAIYGSRSNFKITYPEDVERAEALLRGGGAG